jgi:hypothetical protein
MRRGRSSPRRVVIVGVDDTGDVFIRKVAMGAVSHEADFAGVNEKGFAGTVAVAAIFLGAGEEPVRSLSAACHIFSLKSEVSAEPLAGLAFFVLGSVVIKGKFLL